MGEKYLSRREISSTAEVSLHFHYLLFRTSVGFGLNYGVAPQF